MDVPRALLSAPQACPYFSSPTGNAGASPFVQFNVFQTGHTTGQRIQMPCHLIYVADFCPLFPSTSSGLLHAAGQQADSDHPGTNGHKRAGQSNTAAQALGR